MDILDFLLCTKKNIKCEKNELNTRIIPVNRLLAIEKVLTILVQEQDR